MTGAAGFDLCGSETTTRLDQGRADRAHECFTKPSTEKQAVSAPAYLPLFGSDYLADTRHLSTEEHGAYLLLLMAAWRQDDCGLPLDDRKLARITGLSTRKWMTIRNTILDFWTVDGGRIYQPRLQKERAYADQKSNTYRENARKRWSGQVIEIANGKRCNSISNGNAPQPQPQPQEEIDPKGSCESDDFSVHDFMESWNETASSLGLPQMAKLTPARKRAFQARKREWPDIEDWKAAFRHLRESPFLLGNGNGGWRADCDFFLQAKSFPKLVEGAYGKA